LVLRRINEARKSIHFEAVGKPLDFTTVFEIFEASHVHRFIQTQFSEI
jgi:hypothetical protein